MRLHEARDDFEQLITLTSQYIGIPEMAVKRDYYIVMLLQNLQKSLYADKVVFKGGTSLSKCYPGSIDRFSEDIDLTFIPNADLGSKQYDKELKRIESAIIGSAHFTKISEERNDRNKSAYVWFEEDADPSRIKLEIGSSVQPDPYERRSLKTYIQEYLESRDLQNYVGKFELEEITVNALCIERTFIDKLFSVKRHALCGSLPNKVRHIYDVKQLFAMSEIQMFIADDIKLKSLVRMTKASDSYYFEKRNMEVQYDSSEPYDFTRWEAMFSEGSVRRQYERLHEDLLYTDKKQDFADAIRVFKNVNDIFIGIGE